MFENISSTLQQCGVFFLSGFVIGLFYEALRGLRIMFKHNTFAVFIEDLLFFSACGLVSFIIALTVGIGYFRIYYAVFEAMGAGVYFLTLGRLVNFLMRKVIGGIKKCFFAVFKKLSPKIKKIFVGIAKLIRSCFSKIAKILPKPSLNRKNDLPNEGEMVYNIETALDDGGNVGNAIKAKIRR